MNEQNNNIMPNQVVFNPHLIRKQRRRNRWAGRILSGALLSSLSLPNWFASYAIGTYAIALFGVALMNFNYAMEWYFMVFGIVWVVGFFMLSVYLSKIWSVQHIKSAKRIEKNIFWTSFCIRLIYAVFIHYFYLSMTGEPYEFQAADAGGYYGTALWFSEEWTRDNLWPVLQSFSKTSFSDIGFPLVMLLPIHFFGYPSGLLVIRIMNAFIGSYTALIIYRIVKRSMGETTARIAAIFCMLHPVLICYAGITLKEVVMTWLLVLFIDLADRMFRSRRYTFATIAPLVLVGFSLFMFRTVLGLVAFLSVFFALVMLDTRIVGFGKKILLGLILAGVVTMSVSDTIMKEVREIQETDVRERQEKNLEYRYGEKKGKNGEGNIFAKYAGVAVFAPLIFTIPFPTMVSLSDQEDMRLIHGGNWMRNVMSGFVILAMFMLLLSGDWRKYTLPLAMLLGYLLMLAFTEFAHSLRFHIPVMPFEMMFAAYAITNMRKKYRMWYLVWCLFMVVACFAWNWFKLAGRGLA